MSPKTKPGHTQTIGGNYIANPTLQKLKEIAKHDKRSQAAELEWLIEQRYAEIKVIVGGKGDAGTNL